MRRARLEDIRRRLHQRDARSAPSIRSLSIKNLGGFRDFEIKPAQGFITFCGGTGSGKTSLLTIISALLQSYEDGEEVEHPSRFLGAEASLSVSSGDVDFEQNLILGSEVFEETEGYSPEAFFLNLSERTIEVQNALVGEDLEVLKEGVEPFLFEDEFRDFLSFVCKRRYEKAYVWEVESSNGLMMPFFEVVENGVSYNSKGMGSGELSAFYVAWALRVLDPLSFIIIDEPEAYLPPASHEAIFSMIAHYAVAKRLAVVVSTHSADFASLVPANSLHSIRREDGSRVIEAPADSPSRVLSKLGLRPKRTAVVYVEDNLIRDIVHEVVAAYELSSVCNFDISVRKGGSSVVKKALEYSPFDLKHVSIFAVLDGDMKAEALKWKEADRIVFLPFNEAPEIELLNAAARDVADTASQLGRDARRLHDGLEEAEGHDHHERFSLVAAYMGYSVEDFTKRAWQFWLRTPEGMEAGARLAEEIALMSRISVP